MEYVNAGDYNNAVVSMLSDLSKHPETENSVRIATMLSLTVMMDPSRDTVERFVRGFN